MSDTDDVGGIRLEDVRRLDLQAGDILAVMLPMDDPGYVQDVADFLGPILAERDARAIVLPPGTGMSIVRPAAEELTRQIRDVVRNEINTAARLAARA